MGCKPSVEATDKMENISSVCNVDYATQVKAVILIQNMFRRYKARYQAKKQMAWKIHQLIEYSHEQSQMMLQKMFSLVFVHLGRSTRPQGSIAESNSTDCGRDPVSAPTVDNIDWGHMDFLDSQFHGLRITYPITQSTVRKVVDYLQHGNKLCHRDLLELIGHTQTLLRTMPNISEVSFKTVTVCGDIHGNLDDLITIFKKNCMPSCANPYIFNGDFVDRGPKSLEVLIVLFSCLLCNPESVFLNRGNHEDHIMNLKYGFFKEIEAKYRAIAPELTRMLTLTFPLLPLATIINKKVFVAHGGISNNTDLAVIRGLSREKFTSVLNFDCDDASRETLGEWKQVLDLLWSDPKSGNGVKPNVYRGGGCYFGPDVTDGFLRKYDLKFIIRSHECMMEGFNWCHNGQLLTIFSASNYYELGSNFGAFVSIDGASNAEVIQFKSDDSVKWSKCEKEAVRSLKVEICRNKLSLLRKFMDIDTNNSRYVSSNDWVLTMSLIMNMDLPWRQLAPYFGMCDLSNERVDYRNVLDDIDKEANAQTDYVCVNGDDSNIDMMFRIFDCNNQGMFQYEDLKRGFHNKALKNVFNEDEDLKKLWTSLDLNQDGFVDKSEFFSVIQQLI